MTNQEYVDAIMSLDLASLKQRPYVLFDESRTPTIRKRAQADMEFMERFSKRLNDILALDPEKIKQTDCRFHAEEAYDVAHGYLLTEREEHIEWIKRRTFALLNLDEDWMYPVHRDFCKYCDCGMSTTAAPLALAHDLIRTQLSRKESAQIATNMYERIYQPFVQATRDREEWWAAEDMESNWKIMCCGDAGTAMCAYAHQWSDCREGLALAARGCLEVLDLVPPQGDWPEGVGYWFSTMAFALRFSLALRRLTQGKINLFEHPILKCTGDFAVMLTTPSGRVHNFNDNGTHLGGQSVEALRLLAVESDRPDWLALARSFDQDSVLWLALDDPDLPAEPTERKTAVFHRTGVASLRSGWDPGDTYVGLKCGPSNVGHSHLDANSFIIESQGKPLIIDSGTKAYSFYLGFFEFEKGYRWDFDHAGTVGHSTILVDGKGQTWGAYHPGRMLDLQTGDGWQMVAGDASKCYPDTLTTFIRTVLLLLPDTIIVRDVIQCCGPKHLEWLLHYAGDIRTEGFSSIVTNEGVDLTVTPFLPDREMGWRVNDCTRTSYYKGDPGRKDINVESVCYRSVAPFRAAESFEFLFGMTVGDRDPEAFWQFAGKEGDWELTAGELQKTIRPEGNSLRVDSCD